MRGLRISAGAHFISASSSIARGSSSSGTGLERVAFSPRHFARRGERQCVGSAAEEETMANLQVNGQQRAYDGDPSMPLMWYLRDELALTGTKFGCGVGLCGACTVHLNGEAVRACMVQMSETAGKAVTTIEGLHSKNEHAVQVAWRDVGVPQCGYCQCGQIMQAAALLAKKPAPTDAEITSAMAGNLCRCGCYQRIHAAVRAAAKGA
jgi:isoquinoline 1-oxidoreductase alpha subunit